VDNFRLEGDLVGNLRNFNQKAERAMVAGANYAATRIQSFMKVNAPWTDRTGNARDGLKTQVEVGHNRVGIVLFHSVPYGPYLEVRFGGKYGIIPDALAYGGPLYVQAVGRLLFV
jgi:hypothetical protein